MYEDFRKKGTLEEAVKRIQQINEYIFEADPQSGMLNDAEGDDDNQQQTPDNNQQPGDGEMAQQPEQDGMPDTNGMPQQDGADNVPPQDGVADMSQPDNMPVPDENVPTGDIPGAGPMEPGDEVIDVDELTTKQEETSNQIDGVDEKLTNLAGVLDKFIQALRNNDAKIDDLKRELERRNPTEEEKTEIRRGQSGPYSQTPSEEFKKLDNRMYDGNLIAPDKEKIYTITVDDMNNGSDSDVARSMDAYPKDLMSYFA